MVIIVYQRRKGVYGISSPEAQECIWGSLYLSCSVLRHVQLVYYIQGTLTKQTPNFEKSSLPFAISVYGDTGKHSCKDTKMASSQLIFQGHFRR